jgi:hypothetical protein
VRAAGREQRARAKAPLAARLWPLAFLLLPALAQDWQAAAGDGFTVHTAAQADREGLREVFGVLGQARRELFARYGFALPEAVTVWIHPTLASFEAATAQPWYVAAVADRGAGALHSQRLRVLLERGSLAATLRHELFHLAQPEGWPRWRAEGEAMRFAGERPTAAPLEVSDDELNAILAAPPDRETLARAAATAYWRVFALR